MFKQICLIGLGIGGRVIKLLGIPSFITVTTPDENIFTTVFNDTAWVFAIIFGVIIGFQMIKLFFEIGERYVVVCILTLCAPLGFAMGGSKSTKDIATGYIRMFASMVILLIINVLFLKLILAVLSTEPTSITIIPWCILVVGLTRTAKKADGIIARIGMNPANTGDPLTHKGGAMTMMLLAARTAINSTVSKAKSGNSGKGGSTSKTSNTTKTGGNFGKNNTVVNTQSQNSSNSQSSAKNQSSSNSSNSSNNTQNQRFGSGANPNSQKSDSQNSRFGNTITQNSVNAPNNPTVNAPSNAKINAPSNLQFLVQTGKADIDAYCKRMEGFYNAEENDNCCDMIYENAQLVNYLAVNEAVTRRFFLIFQYENKGDAGGYEAVLKTIEEQTNNTVAYLDYCGLEIVKYDDYDNFLVNLLYSCLNKKINKNVRYGSDKAINLIAPSSIDISEKEYIVADGVYHSYLYITGYGYNTHTGLAWLAPIVEAGDGISFSFSVEKLRKEKILPKISKLTMINRSRMREVSDTRTDFEQMDDAIGAGMYMKEGRRVIKQGIKRNGLF